MSKQNRDQDSQLGPKNTNLVEDFCTCFLPSVVEFRQAVLEKSKKYRPRYEENFTSTWK